MERDETSKASKAANRGARPRPNKTTAAPSAASEALGIAGAIGRAAVKRQVDALRGKETVRGGEIVARILAEAGVTDVFGIIDGTYFGFYSTLGKHGIRLIGPRHETSAVHMAGAFARVTGKLGVCMASNGPGVANALPGVAVEEAEGNRVLLITSARREGIAYPDRGGAFQFFPAVNVIGAMAKRAIAVPSADRVAELTRAALRACFTGRPGVVNLEIPESIMNGTYEIRGDWFRGPGSALGWEGRPDVMTRAPMMPHPDLVEAAADLLRRARRPLIHVGSGVLHAGASDAVHRLARRLEAALCTSWGARCALDERDPRVIPMPCVAAVNRVRNEADVVLVLGSRLGETDWWAKAPYWAKPADQKMIQVDLEAATLGQHRPLEVAIQADLGAFLEALLARLGEGAADAALNHRARWVASVRADADARTAALRAEVKRDSLPMHPAMAPLAAQATFAEDAFLVIDGGNTAIWANFFHQVRVPGTLVSTPKMGMLGAGCAQPLGIQAAFPDRQVYCIIGDGAMGFHLQEIETAVRVGLPVVWLVLCDKQWGMVKMNQQFALEPLETLVRKALPPHKTINADLHEIEFDVVARAMGAHGERVADATGLPAAIRRALASGKPAVIHVDVDPVAHMWAPNLRDFKDMHAEPAG